MARWKLAAPCYLPIIDPQTDKQVVFEQRATSAAGRPAVERWPCHLYLDPDDPTQINDEDPETGEKIVVVGTKAYKRDFVLAKLIPPSPEAMIPLDDEARAISARVPQAINPMSEQAFPANGPDLASVSRQGPSPEITQMREMMAQMQGHVALLVAQNQELAAKLAQAAEDKVAEALDTLEATLPPAKPPSSLNLGV